MLAFLTLAMEKKEEGGAKKSFVLAQRDN